MSKRSECLRACLRRRIPWFIGGSVVSALVSALIALGLMFPGAGTIVAILVGLGLLIFVGVAAVLQCLNQCWNK
jgi:fructose-specific phosphotransferase system IIC component